MYWMIVTGEYPPQPGGVSDYTRLIARGLADAGDEVHVWAPPASAADTPEEGVAVHRLPGRFGPLSLWRLHHALRQSPPGARLLVQYVPQAYGWDTMNLPFCGWLAAAGRRRPLDMMFHEVAVDWESGFPAPRRLRRQLHAVATAWMARWSVRSAARIFMSIAGWESVLRPFSGSQKLTWLPIPSTMPAQVQPEVVANCRETLLAGSSATKLVGHFGTFGGHIADALRTVIPPVLHDQPGVKFLLIGRGSIPFAEELARLYPDLAVNLLAAGALEPAEVAEHLAACDLIVQPYIDGVSSRRTSVMASLALGLPIVTTTGDLTEPVWAESGAVHLAHSYAELARAVGPLLADEAALGQLRARAATLYAERFHLDRTLAVLRLTP